METIQGVGRDATHTKGDSKSTGGRESARESEAADVKDDDGEGQSQHLSLEVEPDGENTPPAENLTDEKAKENTREKREHGDAAGGVGDDGPQADKLQKAKKKRGRLVPGSVVLTALAASDMPNTEKGVFSKQVRLFRRNHMLTKEDTCCQGSFFRARKAMIKKKETSPRRSWVTHHFLPRACASSRTHVVPSTSCCRYCSRCSLPLGRHHLCHKDPYLVVKWGDQEVRTSARRDSGKDCSWPKEELALIVRTKKQLQEPVQVEVGRR